MGTPNSGPLKKFEKPKKNYSPPDPNNTNFYFRILFYYEIGDVCKKIYLKILRNDRVTAIFSSEKNIFKNVLHFRKVNKNCDYLANFQKFCKIFVLHGVRHGVLSGLF